VLFLQRFNALWSSLPQFVQVCRLGPLESVELLLSVLENPLEQLADAILLGLNLLGADLPLFLFFIVAVEGVQLLLVLLLPADPEEMLIELRKDLRDCSPSGVALADLSDLDGCVEDLHDEGGIVSALSQLNDLYFLVELVLFLADGEVVLDLKAAPENEVVLWVLGPVDVVDGLSHSRSAA
jgi:hypothetical protein